MVFAGALIAPAQVIISFVLTKIIIFAKMKCGEKRAPFFWTIYTGELRLTRRQRSHVTFSDAFNSAIKNTLNGCITI